MKKLFLFFAFLQIAAISFAASVSPVVITGKWNCHTQDVSLFKVVSGRLEPVCTYFLDDNRSFGFYFTPEYEGFYAIGSGHPLAKMNKFTFYLKPGDTLNIEANDSTYSLVGKNTPENVAMTDWYNWQSPLLSMAVYFYGKNKTYVDFFPLLDEAVAKPYSPKTTQNKTFNDAFARFREYDFLATAIHFLQTPRSAHPHEDEFPDFYRNINISNLTKDDALTRYPYGSQLLGSMFYVNGRLKKTAGATSLKDALTIIKNDTLKGEYLLQQASSIKTYEGYVELTKPYEQYILTPDQKNRASLIAAKLAQVQRAGEPAINFTCKDINGKDVSLSDFKGKVVLVDVWATWCGPCKNEIPYLKNLEKQLEGKDVVIMSVSIDEAKDLQKWEEFVKKESLGGVQLFAGGFLSDITKFYDIKTIPRFMLFDKKGNIVSKDAPRPSSPELKVLIENKLKK